MANATSETGLDDDVSKEGTASTTTSSPTSVETGSVTAEIAGDPPVSEIGESGQEGQEANGDAEVENFGGAEAGEEFAEATPEQLAAEAGADSAISDLKGIEGFEEVGVGEAAEAAEAGELPEVGTAMEGAAPSDSAEFGFLASLIPTLVSSVGPSVAKLIGGRLRPRTKARIKRLAAPRPAAPRPAVPRPAVPRPAGRGQGGRLGQILSVLARLFESAESMPETESGVSVDEGLVEAAVDALESIIGRDDRLKITTTTGIPMRRICALRIHFPNGRTYRGTGWLLGARAVCTAGHCVYLKRAGGWARRVEVIPGANGTQFPYGQAESTQFRSVKGWVVQGRPESDYGCIVLPQGAFGGRNLGAFGFAAFDPPQLLAAEAVLQGYPGDKPFAELWGMSRKIKTVRAEQVQYDIDTMGGQSGAPVYIKRNGQRYCVAIHNYGGSAVNSATRITAGVYQRFVAWRQL